MGSGTVVNFLGPCVCVLDGIKSTAGGSVVDNLANAGAVVAFAAGMLSIIVFSNDMQVAFSQQLAQCLVETLQAATLENQEMSLNLAVHRSHQLLHHVS